jgi:hypothetical protein
MDFKLLLQDGHGNYFLIIEPCLLDMEIVSNSY